MNEFTLLAKDKLQDIKIRMESYKKGCDDTFQLILDIAKEAHDKNQILWDEKIRLCEEEINKNM